MQKLLRHSGQKPKIVTGVNAIALAKTRNLALLGYFAGDFKVELGTLEHYLQLR